MFAGKFKTFIIIIGISAFTLGLLVRFSDIQTPTAKISDHPALAETGNVTRSLPERNGTLALAESQPPPAATPQSVPANNTSVDLKEPTIAVSPYDIDTCEQTLYLAGRAEPKSLVTVMLTKQGEVPVKLTADPTDSNGDWVLSKAVSYLSAGDWEVRARAEIKNQVSDWSNPTIIHAVKTCLNFLGLRLRYVAIAGVLIVIFIIIGGILIYFNRRIKSLKRSLFEKQVRETTQRFRENFSEIRRDLTDELKALAENAKDRPLTPEEVSRREHMLRELDSIERQTTDEMNEIERRY